MRFLIIFLFVMLNTFCLSAQDQSEAEKQRERVDGVVVDKGLKFSILTFSMSSRNAVNDNNIFVNYVNQKKNSWNIRADGGYILKKNLGLGLGISYGQSKDNNTIKGADGTLTDNKSYSNDYAIRPYIKNFIPLDSRSRFYIINQTELQVVFDRSVKEGVANEILTRTYTSKNTYGIGLRPGLLIFIVRNFAFETTVNIFGINTSVEKSRTSGQPDSKIRTTDMDFKVNVLKLAFGFSTYF